MSQRLRIVRDTILLDNVPIGTVVTVPPEGVAGITRTSKERNGVAFNIRWEVRRTPHQLLPLEILRVRLGEFFPHAVFVGGRKYESSRTTPPQSKKLGFPYDTYYKVQIKTRFPYDPALFSKMPLACWQDNYRAFAVVFPKELILPHGRLPLFIKVSGTGTAVDFSVAMVNEFDVRRKAVGWFGTKSGLRQFDSMLAEGQIIETSFLLVGADSWLECVQACDTYLNGSLASPKEPSTESIEDMMRSALRYYNRVWDARNRTHVHLPQKNVPRFESVEFKHSHITDDITKLVLYRRLREMGVNELEKREHELLTSLTSGSFWYKSDGSTLWHTTTFFTGDGLKAFSHHGTGLVGFPGGMATSVRRLFEYVSHDDDASIAELARSGANWLADRQNRDGSWPALIHSGSQTSDPGCVAGTAEAVRALIAAYLQTGEQRYRIAAEQGIRFLNRDESFFECRQYLRDVDPAEIDGITAEACIHANLDWHHLVQEAGILESAEKWGYYALQWIRPHSTERRAAPSFDGLAHSISPRVDVWGGLLIARAFTRLSQVAGVETWHNHAYRLFENIANLQEHDGGLSETWFLDFPSGLESIHVEPTFVTDAFVEFILDLCRGDGRGSAANTFPGMRDLTHGQYPDLTPSAESKISVSIAEKQPEMVIDGKFALRPAFDGAYDVCSRMMRAIYTSMRRVSIGHTLLKIIPLMKILLNRNFVRPIKMDIGKTSRINVVDIIAGESERGYRTQRYLTPVHEITLSVVSSGVDADDCPAADVEIGINTIAGDVHINQVRVDLDGIDEVLSVYGGRGFHVYSGGNEYSIHILNDMCNGILVRDGRLAIDISLSSNWNFFGEYSLRLRIAQRFRKTGTIKTL